MAIIPHTRSALLLLAAALGPPPDLTAQPPQHPDASDVRPTQVWELMRGGEAVGEALILAHDPPENTPPTFEVLLTEGSVTIYQRFYASALLPALRRHLRDVDQLVGAPRPDSIPAGMAVAEAAGAWFARRCAEATRLGSDEAADANPAPPEELELDRTREHPTFAAGQVWRWKSDPRRLLSVAGTGRSESLGWIVEIDLLPSPDAPAEPLPRTAMLADALERAVGKQVERIERPTPQVEPIAAVGYGSLAELEASVLPWTPPTPNGDDETEDGDDADAEVATKVVRVHHPPGSFAFVRWNGRDYAIGNLAAALAGAKVRSIEIRARPGDPFSLLSSVVAAVEAGGVTNMRVRLYNE